MDNNSFPQIIFHYYNMWKSRVEICVFTENRCKFEKTIYYDIISPDMPKRTFQPHKRSRAKVHGFRARMSSRAGRLVLKRRRDKQRAKIAI